MVGLTLSTWIWTQCVQQLTVSKIQTRAHGLLKTTITKHIHYTVIKMFDIFIKPCMTIS